MRVQRTALGLMSTATTWQPRRAAARPQAPEPLPRSRTRLRWWQGSGRLQLRDQEGAGSEELRVEDVREHDELESVDGFQDGALVLAAIHQGEFRAQQFAMRGGARSLAAATRSRRRRSRERRLAASDKHAKSAHACSTSRSVSSMPIWPSLALRNERAMRG